MIKFNGHTKEATNGHVKASVGHRCDCHKCRFHDQYPHLVGQPLTPEQFRAVNPIVNPPVPTDYGPDVAEAWAAVEVAQEEFWAADKVWEQALRMQSRERLQRGHKAWQSMILHPDGNMIPNPTPKPPNKSEDADQAVAIAKDARDEAGERLRVVNVRHQGLLHVWWQRQRDAEEAERRDARLTAEQAEKTRKRSWLFGQLGK